MCLGSFDICLSNRWGASSPKVASLDISIYQQPDTVVTPTGIAEAENLERNEGSSSVDTEQDDPFRAGEEAEKKKREEEEKNYLVNLDAIKVCFTFYLEQNQVIVILKIDLSGSEDNSKQSHYHIISSVSRQTRLNEKLRPG